MGNDRDSDEVVETSDAEELEELVGRTVKSSNILPRGYHDSYSLPEDLCPPRKKIKLSHELDMERNGSYVSLTPTTSPEKFISTPRRSQSSATMFSSTSPGHLPTSPRSPTQTPNLIFSTPKRKSETEIYLSRQTTPAQALSQDPLLLSEPRPQRVFISLSQDQRHGINVRHKILDSHSVKSTTPRSSPPGPLRRSPSVDPLSLFEPSPLVPSSPSGDEPSVISSECENYEDGLSLFTPPKATLHHVASSPFSPCSPLSPSQNSVRSATSEARRPPSSQNLLSSKNVRSPPPAVEMVPEVQDDVDTRLAITLNEQEQESRYSLRRRKPAQILPFTHEGIQYKLQIKGIPGAFVKPKPLERRHHRHPDDHYEEEAETQQGYLPEADGSNDEDEKWEEQKRRGQRQEERRRRIETENSSEVRRTASERDTHQYPGILQDDLSSTDEEEGKKMKALSNEGRRLLREQEKKRKLQEKEQKRRREEESNKAKRFPLSKRTFVPLELSSPQKRPHSASPENANEEHTDMIWEDRLSSSRGAGPEIPHTHNNLDDASRAHKVLSAQPVHIQQYFKDFGDDYLGIYDKANPAGEPTSSQRHSPPHSSNGLSMNPLEPVIDVDFSEDEEVGAGSEQERDSGSSSSVTDIEIDLPSKHARALYRMIPRFMIASMGKEVASAKKKKRLALPEEKGDNNGAPLLPGQTRVQLATNPKDVREIKGDSESELDLSEDSNHFTHSRLEPRGPGPNNSDTSESEVDDILATYRQLATREFEKPKVIEVDKYDHTGSEGVTGVNDEVQFVTRKRARNKGAMARLHDASAIDYMLARSNTVGGTRRERSSGYNFDIVTTGAKWYGRERQTTLSFPINRKNKKREARRQKPRASTKGRKTEEATSHFDSNHETSDNAQVYTVHDRKNATWKEKQKKRRKHEKSRGVWTMPSGGYRIEGRTPGKRLESEHVTVNLEDEGFHRSLIPSSSPPTENTGWSKIFVPPSPFIAPRRETRLRKSPSPEIANAVQERRPTDIRSDFNIFPLHSGKGFGVSTYIRKGWLHELVNIVDSTQEPVLPGSATLFGFELGPAIGIDRFCSILPRVCDELFEFSTGLPALDSDMQYSQWSIVMRLVSQLISWYLKNALEKEATPLRELVEKQVVRVVRQVQEHSVKFVDTAILAMCWFLVEISARLGHKPASSGSLKDSASLLIRFLLQKDLKGVVKPFQNASEVNDSLPDQYAAELWVRLIHVLDHSTMAEAAKRKTHPFWLVLMDVLQSQVQERNFMTPFEISEDTWVTIFSICTLSQFSVHGMTVQQPHLPSCWDIVGFALKRIRLNQTPEDHNRLSREVLKKRDEYIALVIIRCFHLRDRWQWKLEDASVMLNPLAEIFRSRKFANLLHEREKPDYPQFFTESDWDLFYSYNPHDSAFTMFLKLVAQAVCEDKLYAAGKPSPRVKKLLSMAIPMGALPFSKTSPPANTDRAMLYNRITAVAVAGDLDTNGLVDRISMARRYIPFCNADNTSRFDQMRGASKWGTLLVARNKSPMAIGDWFQEMAETIEAEAKACGAWDPTTGSSEKQSSPAAGELVFLTLSLLGSIRQLIKSYVKYRRYPEPFLFLCLQPILSSNILKDERIKEELGLFTNALFDARSAALPPPSRPVFAPSLPAVEEESQESQDFGVMDLDLDNVDWSALDVPEALGGPIIANNPPDNLQNEKQLREALVNIRFNWKISHFVNKSIIPPPAKANLQAYTSNCDLWLRLWLCCACVEATGGSNMWHSYLRMLDANLEDCTDKRWARRVRLSIMFQVLQLEPTAYLILRDRAFDAFLNALVSDNNTNGQGHPKKDTIEREYAAVVLSLGAFQHPLLSGAECLPPRPQESGDYEFTPQEFVELRIPLLRVIFKNINESITKQNRGNLDVALANQQYIEMCRRMFSAMRDSINQQLNLNKASDKFKEDNDFCHQVLKVLKENPELCNHSQMSYWANAWYNNLQPPRPHVL